VQGGETHDAMLIHLPDQNVMFVGDFIMPYLGAPFVQEGDLQGLLDAIDIVAQKNPRYLLHGHEPLTRNFASATMLAQLKTDLVWLRDQILGAMRRGDERGAIHRANLIPPGLLNDQPDVYQPYLIMREHVIDRTLPSEHWLLAAGFTRPRTSRPRRPSGKPCRLPWTVGKSACQDGGTPDRGRQI